MRAAALEFFEDYEPGRRPRVNEVEISVPGTQDPEISLAQVQEGRRAKFARGAKRIEEGPSRHTTSLEG